jgi:hypothetical protein
LLAFGPDPASHGFRGGKHSDADTGKAASAMVRIWTTTHEGAS